MSPFKGICGAAFVCRRQQLCAPVWLLPLLQLLKFARLGLTVTAGHTLHQHLWLPSSTQHGAELLVAHDCASKPGRSRFG